MTDPKPSLYDEHKALADQITAELLAESGTSDGPAQVPATPDTSITAATADAQASPESGERLQRAFEALEQQRDSWRERITVLSDKNAFEKLHTEATKNGRWMADTGPLFVVDKPLGRLLRDHSITVPSEVEEVRQKAFAFQMELQAAYLAKREEFYPPQSKDKAPDGAPEADKSVNTAVDGIEPTGAEEEKTEQADGVVPEPVQPVDAGERKDRLFHFQPLGNGKSRRYQAANGDIFVIKRSKGQYRITKEGEGTISTLSLTKIRTKGVEEGWIQIEETEAITTDTQDLIQPPKADIQSSEAEIPETKKAKQEKGPENYGELFQGDVWELRDAEDRLMNRLSLDFFMKYGQKLHVEMRHVNRTITPSLKTVDRFHETGSHGRLSLIEELRTELSDLGYRRVKQGTKSEKNEPEQKAWDNSSVVDDDDFAVEGNHDEFDFESKKPVKKIVILELKQSSSYRTNNPDFPEIRIERTEAGYRDLDNAVQYDEETMQKVANSEGWELIGEVKVSITDSTANKREQDKDSSPEAKEKKEKYELKEGQVWENEEIKIDGKKGKDRRVILKIDGDNVTYQAITIVENQGNVFSREYTDSRDQFVAMLQNYGHTKVADTAEGIDFALTEEKTRPEKAAEGGADTKPTAAAPEAERTGSLLNIGETAEFEQIVAGTVVRRKKIKRVVAGYYFLNEDGSDPQFPLYVKEKDVAIFFHDWKRGAGVENQENGVSPEKRARLDVLEAEIAKLRSEVDTERGAFIAKEQEQAAAKSRLSKIFRGIGFGSNLDEELADYETQYTEALFRFKNASLTRLQELNLPPETLRAEMATLIRELEFEEAERLYDERRHTRLEQISKPLSERLDEIWDETIGKVKNGPDEYTPEELSAARKNYRGQAISATGESLVQGLEKIGTLVNKFNKTKYGKYVLAASLAGVGAAALGVTGGGAIPVALAMKRLLSGAGAAAALEAGMNTAVDKRRKNKKENFVEEERIQDLFKEVEETRIGSELGGTLGEANLAALDKYLSEECIPQIRRKADLRKTFSKSRKAGAILIGATVGGLVPREWLLEAKLPFSNAVAAAPEAKVRAPLAAASAPETKIPDKPLSTTEPSASSNATGNIDGTKTVNVKNGAAVGGTESGSNGASRTRLENLANQANQTGPALNTSGTAETARTTTISTPGPNHTVSERVLTVNGQLKELVSAHTVAPGDSIWKIATKSVEKLPDMDKRSSGRFAKLLELKLTEKLTVIDPKLAEAAGFTVDTNGRFTPHSIQAGAKLELGKLLTTDEMTKLLEEAKSNSPITLAGAHASVVEAPSPATERVTVVVPTEAERTALEEARVAKAVPVVSNVERAEILASFSMENELSGPKGNVMRYVGTLPREEQEHLFRNFKRITHELFQTNEVMGGETYSMQYDSTVHPEFYKTNVTGVLDDHKLLNKNPFTSYDRMSNPLHGSQMEEVVKFTKATMKAFGHSLATPRATESVQEYVLRMVAIADNQKVKIPGFRMVK